MRPPEFWMRSDGREAAPMLRALLTPVSWAYAAAARARRAVTTPERIAVPLICIGNVSLGGAGKTPVTRALRALLAEAGIAAHTLSRGHGGRLAGPLRVDPALHTAAEVGDEPLLHAADGPAWIARDRVAGARAALAAGAKAILMDDGFQNPSLAKSRSVLVFDVAAGLGNGCVFPAGPLREPLKEALARCDGVILLRGNEADARARPVWLKAFAGPAFDAWIAPLGPAPAGPLVAFAGIGRPQKLFDTLTGLGADVAEAIPFPDHHPYTAGDLAWLKRLAAERGARLITTEKDLARLDPAGRAGIAALPVAARFADPVGLLNLVTR